MRTAAIALLVVCTLLCGAALALVYRVPVDYSESVLSGGPTIDLPHVGPVLAGQVWVRRTDGSSLTPEHIERVGPERLPVQGGRTIHPGPPRAWLPPPGLRIGHRPWSWHRTLPGREGGPFLVRARAVHPHDAMCTDGATWWTAPCADVRSGVEQATALTLTLLGLMAALALAGAVALWRASTHR